MFLGEFKHQTDEKFRLRVPAKLRKELGKNYIITKGTNGCLFIFSEATFKAKLVDKLQDASLFNPKIQKPIRFLMSSAFEVEEDKQNRFLTPKALREFAGIKKNVVFVGVGTHLELWSEKNWKKYLEDESKDFDKVLGGLSEYGI